MYNKKKKDKTLFVTINPERRGLIIPGIVANVLENPIRTPACWGAISR